MLHTEWDHPKQKSEKKADNCLFESGALSWGLWHTLWRTCHLMGGGLIDQLFGQNNPFLFCFNIVYVCFVGNVAVSVWLAYVWLIISCDYSDWIGLSLWMPIGCYGLYGPYLYDYHLYYPTHQCVIINSNQWECLAIRVCTWVCTSLHTKLFFLFLSFYYSNFSYCIF